MRNISTTRKLTQTALLLALLLAAQYLSASFGQFVTGSLVNFLLIAALLTSGLYSAVFVAALSPILALLLGIGPLWQLVPVIMLGNIAIVLVYYFVLPHNASAKPLRWLSAIIIGAAVKFAVIYLLAVKFILPMLADELPAAMVSRMSTMFSLPQLVTALLGGFIAMLVVPYIVRALDSKFTS